MTKIVAGNVGGRRIKVPAQGTRPTSAKVREALFSKLEHWGAVHGSRVLDLFAGSGALGIEALSRGAVSADFVDRSRPAAQVVTQNLRDLGLQSAATVSAVSASAYLSRPRAPWDLVFIDPPYAWPEPELAALLTQLAPMLTPDALVVIERDADSPQPQVPAPLAIEDHRTWGDTAAWFAGLPPETDVG